MHDPRVGRFFAVDPLVKKYSFQSPYAFATNNPVRLVDVDGLGVEGCCETLKGFVVGMTDNLFGTNFRQTVSVDNVDEFNNGLNAADGASFTVGTLMMIDGQKIL